MGPYESSAKDRQLSLTTANLLTDDSGWSFSPVGLQHLLL